MEGEYHVHAQLPWMVWGLGPLNSVTVLKIDNEMSFTHNSTANAIIVIVQLISCTQLLKIETGSLGIYAA